VPNKRERHLSLGAVKKGALSTLVGQPCSKQRKEKVKQIDQMNIALVTSHMEPWVALIKDLRRCRVKGRKRKRGEWFSR